MFRRPVPACRLPRPFRPLKLERLDDRAVPAIFLVTNTADSGSGSLRQAVLDANAQVNPSPDTILIQAAGTIVLAGQIAVTDPVNITGTGINNLFVSGNNSSRIFFVGDGSASSIHVSISGMTLTNGNDTVNFGGAIASENEDLQLTDVAITNNQATRGGGIDIGPNGRLTMANCTVSGNRATTAGGGGIYLDGNSVSVIRDSTITGNSSTLGNGGGIYLEYGGTLLIQRSYLSFNSTLGGGSNGGALFCFDDGSVVIQESTFSGNFALNDGGAIDAGNTDFTMANSTVTGNSAFGDGGGIYLEYYYSGGGKRPDGGQGGGPGSAMISNSTIARNSASGSGGGIYSGRDVAIANSIISGNSAVADNDLATYYSAFTLNFSLVEDKGNANVIDGIGNIFGVGALLGPLQSNGGPTPTLQLLCGSPGINVADPNFAGSTIDQRGLPRIAGVQMDMGAVEVEFGWVLGSAFIDANGDGARQKNEVGLGNVFVWLDTNSNRSPDNEEVFGRADGNGDYELTALPGSYNVLAELPAGWQRTTGDPGFAFVSAGEIQTGFDFGFKSIAGIQANVSAGFSPFDIQNQVDEFRTALGALNPNVAGTQNNGNGRREINWDGVPDNKAAPNNLPADFFNTTSKRGAVFSTQGTGFQVSSTFVGDGIFNDQRFGNLNDSYSSIFQTFSPQRLFTPLGSTIHDVTFFVPGTTTPATVMGFGAVFVETDNPVQSSIEFFDAAGNSLGVFFVPRPEVTQTPSFTLQGNGGSGNGGGLSFVGIKFTDGRRAARVRITTGNAEIGANDNNLSHDVVVLDDFIYGEPVASVIPPEPPPEPGPVVKITAIGSGPGGNSRVNVYNTAGKQIGGFNAFDISFRGEVHVATADIDGDGFEDVITAAGQGGGPHVQVWGGKKLIETGVAERIVSPLGSFFTFDPRFQGGVFVAAGDVNGDGRMDIISGAGPGGGPHVIAFSGADGTVLTSFYAYDIGFMGGVSVAASDFTGDGRADIATGAGPGGGPHVRIFNPNNGNSIFREFFAYSAAFLGGVYVGAGDLNGDNLADIVTGAGLGGGPHVVARDGQTLNVITQFFAYEAAFPGGVRVSVGDWDGDNDLDILCGAGPLGGPHFRAVDKDGKQLDSFYALFDKDFPGGIFVG